MEKYRVQMMTADSYNAYMTGSWNYWIKDLDIEAETAKDAVQIAKAQNPELIINENPRTVREIEEEKARWVAEREEEKRKEEEKKARAAKREEEKAAAQGLTIEEYKELKKKEAKVKRYEKENRDAEKQIEELKKEIARRERMIEELKKEIGE